MQCSRTALLSQASAFEALLLSGRAQAGSSQTILITRSSLQLYNCTRCSVTVRKTHAAFMIQQGMALAEGLSSL